MKNDRTYPWGDPTANVYSSDGPAHAITFMMEDRLFEVVPTDEAGINIGRQRFKVNCLTDHLVIHPATTSPRAMIDFYLDEQVQNTAVREQLAAYAHEAWSGWMKYLFTKTLSWESDTPPEHGGINGAIIPEPFVERWQRQLSTPYAELPEDEKESDRAKADKILAIIKDSK